MGAYDFIDEDKIRRNYTDKKTANYGARKGTVRGGQADINQSMKDRVDKATGGGKKPTKPKPPTKQGVAGKTLRGASKVAGSVGKLARFGTGPVGIGLTSMLTPSEIAGDDVSGREAIGSVPNQQTPEQIEAQKVYELEHGPTAPRTSEFMETPDTTFPEAPAGVQPSNIPSVRQSQGDFGEPDISYDFGVPGEVTGAVRDSQGRTGTMTAPEELMGSERGTMSTYSGADALQDPQAKDLARQAASGEISTQQYNAGLRSIRQAQESGQGRGGDNASRLADNISRVERELARPGRGANQSLNDMLTEARVRKNKRKALDEMYGLQKQEQTISSAEGIATANRESREAIAEQKSIADRNKEARAASVRSEQTQYERKKYVEKESYTRARNVLADETASAGKKATAMKEATTVYREDAKARYPEDRGRQNMHTAKMQMSHVKPGDSYFTTPEGRIARKDTSEQLHKYMSSERGLVDWIANIPGMVGLGTDDRYSQEDIENMDFSSFNIDDAGEGAYVFRSTIRNADGSHDEYAYQHSMNPEFVSVIRKLIANDKAKKARGEARGELAERTKSYKASLRQGQR